MPTDTKFPYQFDESGDTDIVGGSDFYEQHAQLLGLLATTEIRGDRLDANQITKIESAVEQRLRGSPYFEEPVVVTARDVDGDTVTLEARTRYQSDMDVTIES